MMDKINPDNPANLVNPVTIGVVGAGTMGNGIAQVAARAAHNVIMHDVSEQFLSRGLSAIDKSLQRDVDKERLDKERLIEGPDRRRVCRPAGPSIVRARGLPG